jgi:hypothetical protein
LPSYVALQKLLCCHANKQIARGIWHTYAWATHFPDQGNKMSKTASLSCAPSTTLFSRLLSAIDRILMANANIALRNGDLLYFGL